MDMNELNKFLDCKNAFESAQLKIGGEAKEIYLEYFKAGMQHQQAKVEELEALYTQQGINMLKLQKRVDAVKGLAQNLWEKSNEKHEQGKVWESKALGECADEILDVLEQALKGEG